MRAQAAVFSNVWIAHANMAVSHRFPSFSLLMSLNCMLHRQIKHLLARIGALGLSLLLVRFERTFFVLSAMVKKIFCMRHISVQHTRNCPYAHFVVF